MRNAVLAAAAVAVIVVATAGIAVAAPSGKTDAQVLGNVRIDASDPTVAYVTARYICNGGTTNESHLWVSVKQNVDARANPLLKEEESGFGGYATAWSSSHRNPVTCDGQWHVGSFTVDQEEYGWGELRGGQAYVQFCLFGGDGTFVSSMRFAAIH